MKSSNADLNAAKLRDRIKSLITQEFNKRFETDDLRRDRNEGGAVQVRSISGSVDYATMSSSSSSTVVGP